jgi:two-component system, chemotaxis family, chemotaxis protein CheY
MTVLVVDDEPAQRQLVHRLVATDFGADVIEADDGLSALDRLLGARVDLVMLDLNMRVMDGLETLQAIRRSRTYDRVPIVLMTGHAEEKRLRQAMELGLAGVIAKPFTPAILHDRLAKILARRAEEESASGLQQRLFDLEEPHRVLVVDQSPQFRSVAAQVLRKICQAEEAENEFAALRHALNFPVDFMLLGATSEFFADAAFVKKVRETKELRHVRLLAAVPTSAMESTAALGVYDAVLERSFLPEVFEGGLRRLLSETSRGRLLCHPTSSFVSEWFDQLKCRLTDWLHDDAEISETPPHPRGAPPWILGAAEIQSARVAWDIRLRSPQAAAVKIGGARQRAEVDVLSQHQELNAIAGVVKEFAQGLQAMLLDYGLPTTVSGSRVSVVGATGSQPLWDEPLGSRRWFTVGRREIASVELVPLVSGATIGGGRSREADRSSSAIR